MGRVAIREGEVGEEDGVRCLDPRPIAAASEATLAAAFESALAAAAGAGARVAALSLEGEASIPLQRRAEILFEAARRAMQSETSLEEIRFHVTGEPRYRVLESVQDAARIAEQMERLRRP